MTTYGQDLQARVYGAGHAPELPVSYEGWESRAREILDDGPFDYVAGGAGAEDTMRANREAFDRWRIVPRMLRGASDRDLTTEILGLSLPVPFMLAPVGVLSIVHPDDARDALDHGVQGLVVSNHGGRQVDGAVAALDALPGIRQAVGERLALLFDSGVRRGADVVKALALGADAALIGRPYAYGLAVAGAEGVEHVIRNLTADLDLGLALSGHRSASEVDRTALASTG